MHYNTAVMSASTAKPVRPRQRIAAIFNPVSGRRDVRSYLRTLTDRLSDLGATLELHETQSAGHAEKLAAGLGPSVEALLIAGGDGTVSEVVQGLHRDDLPLAILRTGTENLLARELGMPADPGDMALTLTQGSVIHWDAGLVNGRRFIAVVGVGFDAECVRNMTEQRCGHINRWSYFRPVWRAFWNHSFPPFEVEIDGKAWYAGSGLVIVGLIKRYGGGVRLLASADPTDGLLDVLVLPCKRRWDLIPHYLRILRRRHVHSRSSRYVTAKQVRVTSDYPIPVQVDGEVGGALPLEARIVPRALQFLKFTGSEQAA